MNVYFFSSHVPDLNMVEDLGGITAQFKGDISNIERRGHQITFTEALFLGRQDLKCCHIIPAESIVVIDDSPLLQGAWLDARVSTLLIPQMKQEAGKWGSVSFKYCGLLQVHQIEVITSQWAGSVANTEEPEEQKIR